ncbi:hypothetical protein FA95DRAFT_1567545 [Auriscalpium vulgare]|uniref:Uncharacterized protein n=1 Tax=Auriscalpium vulgare TaxID=40419 RepID=A0ACB8R3W1_9AGAM|nr:hypothetical protein FA95DRAFT_1567545 [Auriscalpium vulgare]
MQMLGLLLALALPAAADSESNSSSSDAGFESNPYLHYRPAFSRSLPTQVLVNSITLTLVAVLLIQLIFTAQYHVRLAQANFILQISAVLTLLGSMIATLAVVLGDAKRSSQDWPFMLNYLAVDLPPLLPSTKLTGQWTTPSTVAWLVMNATYSALIQVTHIQFLTLMYPSRLEARLIFILLGPLAIIAAVMQLLPIQSNNNIASIADAVRNVCAAALSLLFTLALIIWGTVVNRKQAWRTDGGTAAFGAGALILAIASCVLTFQYIPRSDQYDWMPPLTGAVMLWQTFLGWWWWVGAGMGVGEVEELMRREEKRSLKRRRRDDRRREQKEKARVLWQGMTGKLMGRPGLRRRQSDASGTTDSGASASERMPNTPQPSTAPAAPPATLWGRMTDTPLAFVRNAYHYLRTSHMVAARHRAHERVQRMNAVFGDDDAAPPQPWGLGSFGVRERERELEESGEVQAEMEGFARSQTEGEAVESDEDGEEVQRQKREEHEREKKEQERRARESTQRGMWWWGPFRRWRLQDSTVY